MDINLQLEEIILLLDQNKFVESHDIFEELWRKYKNNESTRKESFILKAFVNGSVSIELYKMQRFEHCSNVWNTYKKYEYLIDEIGNVEVYRVKGPENAQPLEEEARRIIKLLPQFTPGKQSGKAIAVRHVIPITFRMQ